MGVGVVDGRIGGRLHGSCVERTDIGGMWRDMATVRIADWSVQGGIIQQSARSKVEPVGGSIPFLPTREWSPNIGGACNSRDD